MFRRLLAGALVTAFALLVPVRPSAAPEPALSATPSPNPRAERIFARAREAWRSRDDLPYVRYGALVRYLSGRHVFDNWWDAYYRSRDGAISLEQIHDAAEENRRLAGVPFSIFNLKLFDTNPDAEPIRIDEPRIDPVSSFGMISRFAASPAPAGSGAPSPAPSDEFREITRVEANTRDYQVELAGTETFAGQPALHLTLVPLRDEKNNRLRDLWIDPVTFRTIALTVQGLLSGKPYDGVKWTVRYVVLDGRNYIQQIVADEPLHFGLDTTIPKFEFDFVDFHFPADVPPMTFDRHVF